MEEAAPHVEPVEAINLTQRMEEAQPPAKVEPMEAEDKDLAPGRPETEDPPRVEEALLNDSIAKGACEEQPDNASNDSAMKETASEGFGGSGSETDETDETKEQPEDTRRRMSYVARFALLFLVIGAAVILPVALLTDAFKKDSSSAPAPVPASSGGLPFPETVDSLAPSVTFTVNSLAPSESFSWEGTGRTPMATIAPTDAPAETAAPSFAATQEDTPKPTPKRPGASTTEVHVTITQAPSYAPTISPTTLSPTDAPGASTTEVHVTITSSPTTAPTISPTTLSPTDAPTTAEPTIAPTTGAPTPEPSLDMNNTPLFSYLTVLGTPAEVLADPTTPQGKAYRWLLLPDVEKINVFRVPQRFALVALDFALHEQEYKIVSAWQAFLHNFQSQRSYNPFRQKDKDVCKWEGITCDDFEEVVAIKWSNKELKGEMIPEIALMNRLQKVDLAKNRITGNLQPFWELPELTHLYLFRNRFSGTIPDDRPAPSKLVQVYLGHNELSGTLPLSLASSKGPKDLRYLILHHNRLEGRLPEGMRLRNLFYLDLSNNDFEGPIPSDWVFYFVELRILYLGNNRLSGELPEDWGMLGNGRLKQLYIENNEFSGSFPSDSWSDYYMTNMNIGGNNFDEEVDKQLCKLSVFEGAELVELRADCDVCRCDTLCHTCLGGTEAPSFGPTIPPSNSPTSGPTEVPSSSPTIEPSQRPSVSPSIHPSQTPTVKPSQSPSIEPTTNAPTKDKK